MKLPRGLSGRELITRLARLGYVSTRQEGSHVRLTHMASGQHVSVPDHSRLKPGTLRNIMRYVCYQQGIDYEELLRRLFG